MQAQDNHISTPKTETVQDQPVTQKPMSIQEYTKALRAEAEVAKLRATIAKSMFEETMAMVQLQQLKAGQFNHPQAPKTSQELDEIKEAPETTEVD